MKYALLLIITLSITSALNGQKLKRKGLQLRSMKEISSWTGPEDEFVNSMYDLTPVKDSLYKTHIRIGLSGEIIDFFSIDNIDFNGIITLLITQEDNKDKRYPDNTAKKIVYQKVTLNKELVESVCRRLMGSGQFELPTDSLIENWKYGFIHCSSVSFESKIGNAYKLQDYFCPWGQTDSIKSKKIALNNYDLLRSTFNIDSLRQAFYKLLPKGKTYSIDGYGMMYKMSDSEIKRYNKTKPIRDYLESIKDTVDNYLSDRLSKQTINLDGKDCYEEYRVLFGKNGRLKKVTIADYDKPTLKDSYGLKDYFESKRQVRFCKSKVKQMFKGIDLSFLKLKYQLSRGISFGVYGDLEWTDY